MVIKVGDNLFYIKGNKKLRILSERVLASQGFNNVIEVTQDTADKYPTSGRLGFRDGTVIVPLDDPRYYLISQGKSHLVTDPDVVELFKGRAITVSPIEFKLHERGVDL
jgi:hypothetical protein